MKPSSKILILILIQITLLIVTYLIIEVQESAMTELGYRLNVSGKIRALTYGSINSIVQYHYSGTYDRTNFYELKYMVSIIESGGEFQGKHIPGPININKSLVSEVKKNFDTFSILVNRVEKSPSSYNENELYQTGSNLFLSADNLTTTIADYNAEMSKQLVRLAFGLISLNIVISIVLVVSVTKILKQEHSENIKTEKMKIIGELAARLSHDLRNPLSIINMATDVLQKINIENNKEHNFSYFEKIQAKLEMIQRSARLMNHQVNDVLNFARTSELQLTDEYLQTILKNSVQKLIIPEGIKISFPQNDVKIHCDSKKLEVVFTNLIQNSIEAIESSGKIIIRVYEFEKNVVIDIEDSGKGFSNDIKSNLFLPLFTTKTLGTGLGLVTCKNIIEQHHGTISVKTNPTIFSISLPLHRSK